MKLTQKVDHFTVFKNFPSTSCCSQKFPPNNLKKKLAGWMCEVVSIISVAASFSSPNIHSVDCASFQPLRSQYNPSRLVFGLH